MSCSSGSATWGLAVTAAAPVRHTPGVPGVVFTREIRWSSAEEIACSRAAELFHLIDQAQPARDGDRLNAIVGTGLAIDVVKVELDGRLRHEQSLRDRLSP